MRLWSWQTPDYSVTDGHADPTKGEYWEDVPTIRAAYAALWPLLGVRSIVWCYTCRTKFFLRPSREMVVWVIDVPDYDILRFVDAELWHEYVHGDRDPRSPQFLEIFIDRPKRETDAAIIRHPVPASWVLERQFYVGAGKWVLPPE